MAANAGEIAGIRKFLIERPLAARRGSLSVS